MENLSVLFPKSGVPDGLRFRGFDDRCEDAKLDREIPRWSSSPVWPPLLLILVWRFCFTGKCRGGVEESERCDKSRNDKPVREPVKTSLSLDALVASRREPANWDNDNGPRPRDAPLAAGDDDKWEAAKAERGTDETKFEDATALHRLKELGERRTPTRLDKGATKTFEEAF